MVFDRLSVAVPARPGRLLRRSVEPPGTPEVRESISPRPGRLRPLDWTLAWFTGPSLGVAGRLIMYLPARPQVLCCRATCARCASSRAQAYGESRLRGRRLMSS